MKKLLPVLIICGLILSGLLFANVKMKDKYQEERSSPSIESLDDRTYNILDINKLGMYVSNLGQFYSSWQEIAPEGEWPIYSGHEQLYRMNVYVGIPDNVVQTRSYSNKEWDPVPGYDNPDVGLLAVSNDTTTWPLDAGIPYWPLRNTAGGDSILSDQDSYGVYRDSTNHLYLTTLDPSYLLNVVVHQRSMSWYQPVFHEDYIYFVFDLVNEDEEPRDSLYFCLYTDIDAGGFDDYDDDYVGLELDRGFYYMYDSDNWSPEWNDVPFYFGGVFIETPEVNGQELGITDFHYVGYYDEPSEADMDVQQYGLMSSDSALWADSLNWPGLFHGDNIHYDDTSLIPAGGGDWVMFVSSGPYHMEPGDTLTFVTAMIAGADYNDISSNADRVLNFYENNFQDKVVPPPLVSVQAGDQEVTLSWSNALDTSYVDFYTLRNNLMGYRIYKAEGDPPDDWGEPIDSLLFGEYIEFPDPGDYVWTDMDVTNGFYYSYAVTAFDSTYLDSSYDPQNMVYESSIAPLNEQINSFKLRPFSAAQTNTSEIRVVPNPYVISATWETERVGNPLWGEPVKELSFINLPANSTIKIFTIDGDLVKTIKPGNQEGGTVYWDIRSDYNQMVATGVYFYYVKSSVGEKVGKFAIIR